jgi:hypothetical protein
LVFGLSVLIAAGGAAARGDEESGICVARPDTAQGNKFYPGNRPPLLASPFVKLPVGAIRPQGWLRKQLELEAEGFSGHLHELSGFLREEGNAWLSPKGEGHSGWEELPYWLKGYGDLGYVLANERIIKDARRFVEAALASQREDGWFGPRSNLHSEDDGKTGKPDVWPNMIMLNVLQSYYEYSGDKRVLQLMTKYLRWELDLPEEDFLPGSWQKVRGGDNLASVYWLYNITGEPWLLELAAKIHRRTIPWEKGVANWHGVNICQSFREPAVYYQQSKDAKHLAATVANYDTVMDLYGQVPGGMFGADENCRTGFGDPRQCAESCSMVEMMLSAEMLLRITGEALWADRCEEVAFNSLPASMTPDLKSLRYLTGPNQILSDRHNKAPGVQNGGAMMLFDPRSHRCCQHNVAHGWPYFTENLWQAAPGNGLAAVMYAPCQVKAKVGDGTEVTITETTRYPFEDSIEMTIATPTPVAFPLYLRVPEWCSSLAVKINGKALAGSVGPGFYMRIDRTWSNGDKLAVHLPMKIEITKWSKNHDSVSVQRGPLTYSLQIGEKYVRVGGTDQWPAVEIHPTTPWNYGLVLNEKDPAKAFEVFERPWPKDDQPFVWDATPIEMRVKAKKIPAWQADHQGLVGLLQQSPARSDESVEDVTLIPMGCARLRISAFPAIGSGAEAHQWIAPAERDKPSASHCFHADTLTALNDGQVPKASGDKRIPRFTWWDHKGAEEWVAYTFPKPRQVSQVEVYWFDDTGSGHCRVPKAWHVEWLDGQTWRPVAGAGEYGVALDRFNKVTFQAVTAGQVRLVVELQPNFSAGILEWRVK